LAIAESSFCAASMAASSNARAVEEDTRWPKKTVRKKEEVGTSAQTPGGKKDVRFEVTNSHYRKAGGRKIRFS